MRNHVEREKPRQPPAIPATPAEVPNMSAALLGVPTLAEFLAKCTHMDDPN